MDETHGANAPTEGVKYPLFSQPLWKDWAFLLGSVAVAAASVGSAREYGNPVGFNSDDWVALTIDVALAAGINAALFGVLPAFIRSRVADRRGRTVHRDRSTKWGLFFVLVSIASVLLTLENQGDNSEPSSTSQSERCTQRGADRVCISGKEIGDRQAEITAEWEYASSRELTNGYAAKVVTVAVMDCGVQTRVKEVRAYDTYSQQIFLTDFEREAMEEGVLAETLRLRDEACG